MKPIRVAFIDHIRTEIGGRHFVLARLANYYFTHDMEIEPIVFLNNFNGFIDKFLVNGIKVEDPLLNVKIVYLSRNFNVFDVLKKSFRLIFSFIKFGIRFYKLIHKKQIDIFHINDLTMFSLCALPIKISGKKIIFHLHDTLLSSKQGGTMQVVTQLYLLFWMKVFSDRVIVVSNFVRNTIISKTLSLRKKVCVINNGLDIKKISQLKPAVYKNGYPNLLVYGRLDAKKGIDVAIKAVAFLKIRYGYDIKLKIIGTGPLYHDLEDLIKKENLESQIRLLGFKYNVHKYVAQSDIIIIPSIWEDPLPLTVIESMANTKIIIASKVGGIPEMITNRKEGFLVSKANPEAIAEKVVWIIKHPDKANQISRKAYSRVVKEFTINKMVSNCNKIYQSI